MKIADSEKEKAQKRMQSLASNMFGLGLSMQLAQGSLGNLGMATNTYQQVDTNCTSYNVIILNSLRLVFVKCFLINHIPRAPATCQKFC